MQPAMLAKLPILNDNYLYPNCKQYISFFWPLETTADVARHQLLLAHGYAFIAKDQSQEDTPL